MTLFEGGPVIVGTVEGLRDALVDASKGLSTAIGCLAGAIAHEGAPQELREFAALCLQTMTKNSVIAESILERFGDVELEGPPR